MKSKTKTSTSEGEELADQYAARQQVRVARIAHIHPAQQATLRDALLFGTGFEMAGANVPAEEVRVERAQMMSPKQAAQAVTRHTEETHDGVLSASTLDEMPPATDNGAKTSSPELATLAAQYLNVGSLTIGDVENVRRLAASVLSQAAPK